MTCAVASDDSGDLFRTVQTWLDAGHRVALATVIETWGSAPRRTGAHLAVRDDGLFEGSVSGGCVEGEVVAEAIHLIARGAAARLDFGVADETAWRVGLACGGRIAVIVQPMVDSLFPPALAARLVEARAAGEVVTLATSLADFSTRESASGDFVRRYAPPQRVALIGAVHIAQALAPMAAIAGFAPTVIDPRGMFATDARFPDAPIDARWPDEALAQWRPDAASAVVALTHDPKLDDAALAAALRSPAFYIAALGSRRNHAARIVRLSAMGFDAQATARIHGPAGLAIGAANPAEIAVSILAQMIAAWRGSA